MKFSTPKEMLKYIQDGNDIWAPKTEKYVFQYSDLGSICCYKINETEAKELQRKSEKLNEYWSAFLGIGGNIFDSAEWCKKNKNTADDFSNINFVDQALVFCEDNYQSEWIDCKVILQI